MGSVTSTRGSRDARKAGRHGGARPEGRVEVEAGLHLWLGWRRLRAPFLPGQYRTARQSQVEHGQTGQVDLLQDGAQRTGLGVQLPSVAESYSTPLDEGAREIADGEAGQHAGRGRRDLRRQRQSVGNTTGEEPARGGDRADAGQLDVRAVGRLSDGAQD